MSNSTGSYPSVRVDSAGTGVVSQAGGLILTDIVRASGLGAGLSAALSRWRRPFAVHDPGKILTDLGLSLATGGDCLADVDRLHAKPQVYGRVASDPTVSRLVTTLSTIQPAKALAAINAARAQARAHIWAVAGEHSPLRGVSRHAPLVVDLDATLLISHSEKEDARPTWKKGYGFHPLTAFLDHGADGTGEPLASLLWPGNAGSNTAADHIHVTKDALQQLPKGFKSGRRVMIRTDSAGGTHEYLNWLTHKDQDLSYSVGFPLHGAVEAVLAVGSYLRVDPGL